MRWRSVHHAIDDAAHGEIDAALRQLAVNMEGIDNARRGQVRAVVVAAHAARYGRGWAVNSVRRRPRLAAVGIAFAALLLVGGTVAAAESGPGQPFYGLRLSLESFALPAGGSARAEALLAQLDRRLEEAEQENTRGNAGGVSAAVHAYLVTLDEVSGGAGEGVSRAAVNAGLQRHLAVIQEILQSAPADARGGLEQAMQHAQQALKDGRGRDMPDASPAHPGPAVSPPGRS